MLSSKRDRNLESRGTKNALILKVSGDIFKEMRSNSILEGIFCVDIPHW